MTEKLRDYVYHESTTSMCSQCLQRVPAKVIIQNAAVYIQKRCPQHGIQVELLEEDASYYLRKREYDKPGTVSVTQTEVNQGCPFDCGLCPEHDQHTCIGLIEVTGQCNLNCPVCFADSGAGEHLSLEKIAAMMDFYQQAEGGRAEILQISGGEPTEHPEIIKILQMAREKRFKYLMLNTNGLRIAEDQKFVKELSQFVNGFEIYLQWDGFSPKTYLALRGRDLTQVKERAIENLTKYGIPTALVATIAGGVNDHELGEIITFGIKTKYIRGVNFQPLALAGRGLKLGTGSRVTLSGVLQRIEQQTQGMIQKNDFIPLPCNVERVALTYLFKTQKGFIPITRKADVKKYLSLINNTFVFKMDEMLREVGQELLNPERFWQCCNLFNDYRKIVPPGFSLNAKDAIENTFRISVSYFVDAHNFELKSMQKECVHIITPDLKRIPFSAYNMLYRRR